MEEEDEIKKSSTEKWVDLGSELVDHYEDLIMLRIVEKASLWTSIGMVGLLTLVLAVFILLFAGFGVAWWLGEEVRNMKVGFFIVGAVYFVSFLICILTFRKVLVPWIRNFIIRNIYEQN